MDRLLNLKKYIAESSMKMKWWDYSIIVFMISNSKAPSIDTPLHAFLPFKHIDHLHPDAAIAIAAAKDGKKITQELLMEPSAGWIGNGQVLILV